MEHPILSARTLVSEALAASPEVVKIFLGWRVDRVGCSLTRFCDPQGMCRVYGLDLENEVEKLREVLSRAASIRINGELKRER